MNCKSRQSKETMKNQLVVSLFSFVAWGVDSIADDPLKKVRRRCFNRTSHVPRLTNSLVQGLRSLQSPAWSKRDVFAGPSERGLGFGYSVALSSQGTIAAIGAPDEFGNDAYRGQVQVVQHDGQSWQPMGSAVVGKDGDRLGSSLALSSDGKTMAIGAKNRFVQVLRYDDSRAEWAPVGGSLFEYKSGFSDRCSVSMSSDGSIVAVGIPDEVRFGHSTGQVMVFELVDGKWEQLGAAIIGKPDALYGWSIDLSSNGNVLAVGAPQNHYLDKDSHSGYVEVYKLNGGDWSLWKKFVGKSHGDEFGRAISLSSDGLTLAIGATKNDDGGNDAGQVSVYRSDDGRDWSQLGEHITSGEDLAYFGRSLQLSGDGNTLVVGADGSNSSRGHVGVYKINGLAWKQVGEQVIGQAEQDSFGFSVATSYDGKVVLAGAPFNSKSGHWAGQAVLFSTHGSSKPQEKPAQMFEQNYGQLGHAREILDIRSGGSFVGKPTLLMCLLGSAAAVILA